MSPHGVLVVTLRDTAGQLLGWPPVSAGPARRAAAAAFGAGGAGDRALPPMVGRVSCLRRSSAATCGTELPDRCSRSVTSELPGVEVPMPVRGFTRSSLPWAGPGRAATGWSAGNASGRCGGRRSSGGSPSTGF